MGGSNDSLAVLVTLAICIMVTLIIFFTVITMFIAFMSTMKKSRHTRMIQTHRRRRR